MSDIRINNLRHTWIIVLKRLAISIDIKDIRIKINPPIVITATIGVARMFDNKNVKDKELKFTNIIGKIAICADIITAMLAANLDFIYFSNKFVIFLLNATIPIVPAYDSCKPTFSIEYGLYISMANNDIAIVVNMSDFL